MEARADCFDWSTMFKVFVGFHNGEHDADFEAEPDADFEAEPDADFEAEPDADFEAGRDFYQVDFSGVCGCF